MIFKKKKDNKIVKKEFIQIDKQSTNIEDLGFSINKNRAFKLSELDTKRHGLIIGASGWGKSNLIRVLQENDLNSGRPIIFFDPKGSRESIKEFEALCKKYQRTFYIFSEFYGSNSIFNPFCAIVFCSTANGDEHRTLWG